MIVRFKDRNQENKVVAFFSSNNNRVPCMGEIVVIDKEPFEVTHICTDLNLMEIEVYIK